MRRARFPRSNLFPASFATSELLAADVSPQQIATVDVGLLTRAEARERLRTPYATIMCAVAEIRYANGARLGDAAGDGLRTGAHRDSSRAARW